MSLYPSPSRPISSATRLLISLIGVSCPSTLLASSSPCVAKGADDVLAARPTDNAVVDHDDPFTLDDWFDSDDFLDNLLPALVGRFYEAAQTSLTPVPILHQTLLHGNVAFLAVAESCGPSRVRDWYDHVCFERVLLSQNMA